MGDVRERVAVEMENVERTLEGIPPAQNCPNLSNLELAGVAALLHNLYNGMENILKQVIQSRGMVVPTGDSWHRDLLSLAAKEGVVGPGTVEVLKPYLAFRHFFSHAYALDLQAPRMEALVSNACVVVSTFRRDIDAALDSANRSCRN